jgi:hypothetical protein
MTLEWNIQLSWIGMTTLCVLATHFVLEPIHNGHNIGPMTCGVSWNIQPYMHLVSWNGMEWDATTMWQPTAIDMQPRVPMTTVAPRERETARWLILELHGCIMQPWWLVKSKSGVWVECIWNWKWGVRGMERQLGCTHGHCSARQSADLVATRSTMQISQVQL